MVTELGGIKIMDFGIARVRGAEHMTLDGCAVGTPAYMAPEQVLGEEVDGRADLYGVGLILYRLLAGKLPFGADTPITMLQKHISEIPPALHVYRQDLPEWCDAVVQRALAKSPADRFQTAGEFREAVGRAIGLPPALDLANAVGISEPSSSSEAPEAQPAETVVISRTDVGLSPDEAGRTVERESEHASVVRASLPATLARIKTVVVTHPVATVIAAACALAVLAFLASGNGRYHRALHVNENHVVHGALRDGDVLLVGKHRLAFEVMAIAEPARSARGVPTLGKTAYLNTKKHRELLTKLRAERRTQEEAAQSSKG